MNYEDCIRLQVVAQLHGLCTPETFLIPGEAVVRVVVPADVLVRALPILERWAYVDLPCYVALRVEAASRLCTTCARDCDAGVPCWWCGSRNP